MLGMFSLCVPVHHMSVFFAIYIYIDRVRPISSHEIRIYTICNIQDSDDDDK